MLTPVRDGFEEALQLGGTSAPTLHIRPLGEGEYSAVELTSIARGVYESHVARDADFEYYLASQSGAGDLRWPATAPQISQTVVVTPGAG